MENTANQNVSPQNNKGLFRLWLLFALRYLAVFTPLSLIWEFAHMPLYSLWQSGSTRQIILYGLHCTGGDVLIAAAAFSAAVVLFGRKSPLSIGSTAVFSALLVFGFGYTVFSEWLNVVMRDSWAYTAQMPVLPPFGTGLSPALQWIIIPAISYFLAKKYTRRRDI